MIDQVRVKVWYGKEEKLSTYLVCPLQADGKKKWKCSQPTPMKVHIISAVTKDPWLKGGNVPRNPIIKI